MVAPITYEDRVIVKDNYLVYQKDPSRRFFVKGIAFPVAPIHEHKNNDDHDDEYSSFYNAKGWIAILRQLRKASPHINTIRLYELYDVHDYSEFFHEAARLGFYLVLPLTSGQASTGGILNRNKPAPHCYTEDLYHYGTTIVDSILLNTTSIANSIVSTYPNILAAVLGNEVMNSLPAWQAAPCILAFGRDLKRHALSTLQQQTFQTDHEEDLIRRLHDLLPPFMYATQHDGIGAAVSPAEMVQWTLEYMATCAANNHILVRSSDQPISVIDIFGINIESWCSSEQQFGVNSDGTIGTYLDLYQQLAALQSIQIGNDSNNETESHGTPVQVPILFSEVGCSKQLFNRDNGLRTPGQIQRQSAARDWKQLSVIMGLPMKTVWSGFVAYSYGGPTYFRMTKGGLWDGVHPLDIDTTDMHNFLNELNKSSTLELMESNSSSLTDNRGTSVEDGLGNETTLPLTAVTHALPSHFDSVEDHCANVQERFETYCKVKFVPVSRIPSFVKDKELVIGGGTTTAFASRTIPRPFSPYAVTAVLVTTVVLVVGLVLFLLRYAKQKPRKWWPFRQDKTEELSSLVNPASKDSYRTFAS